MTDDVITRGDDPSYRDALIEKLGGADPVHELSTLFERLPEVLVGLNEAQLVEPEAVEKWSVLEVVRHLADVELVQAIRLRRVLTEEDPVLAGMDPNVWLAEIWTPAQTLQDALDQLRSLRVANLHLIASLDEARLDRAGTHSERGVESLRTIILLMAAHDRVHLDQIRRIRATIGAPAGEAAEGGGA